MGQIQQHQPKVAEDSYSTESSELSFDEIDNCCGNAKENGNCTKIVLLEARLQMLEAETKLLKEKIQLLEEKQIPQPKKKCSESNQQKEKKCSNSKTINAIQQKIDESAKEIATQNAEYQKQKQELEIEMKLALKSVEEKYQKKIGQLEAKNWERNANFAKEMASLKEQHKEKINWNQVDLVMGKKQPRGIVPLNPGLPLGNRWKLEKTNKSFSISTCGLKATSNSSLRWHSVSTEKGFIISADSTRPALYYFEVIAPYSALLIGLSNGNIPNGSFVGRLPNSYGIVESRDNCCLSGKSHVFEWPEEAIEPEWNRSGNWENVVGCGIFLSSTKKLSLFFTLNGILMGKQIPINPTVNTLYPTISLQGKVSVEANFGDDQQAKPFKYDIEKCPGLVLD